MVLLHVITILLLLLLLEDCVSFPAPTTNNPQFLECLEEIVDDYLKVREPVLRPITVIGQKNKLTDLNFNLDWPTLLPVGNLLLHKYTNLLIYARQIADFVSVIDQIKKFNQVMDNEMRMMIWSNHQMNVTELGIILRREDVNALLVMDVPLTVYSFKSLLTEHFSNKSYCSVETQAVPNVGSHNYTVLFANYEPYFIDLANNSVSGKDLKDKGIEFNVLDLIADVFNLTLRFVMSSKYFDYGDVQENGTVTGELRYLDKYQVDVAISEYSLTEGRTKRFHYSFPYLWEKLSWCVPHQTQHLTIGMQIFDLYTVLVLVVVLILGGTVVYFTSEIDLNLLIWKQCGIILGTPVTISDHHVERCVFGVYCVINFFLNAAIITALTSSLSKVSNEELYGTLDKLVNSKLDLYTLPAQKVYYLDTPLYDRIIGCDNLDECMGEAAYSKKSAFAVPNIVPDYISAPYKTKSGQPLLYCLKDSQVDAPVTLYMRRGFPLYKKWSHKLLVFAEMGFVWKWIKDYIIPVNKGRNRIYLSFNSLRSVFLLLIIGNLMSVVVWILELLVFRFANKNGTTATGYIRIRFNNRITT